MLKEILGTAHGLTLICGPSQSWKSTMACRLMAQLKRFGLVDDFFIVTLSESYGVYDAYNNVHTSLDADLLDCIASMTGRQDGNGGIPRNVGVVFDDCSHVLKQYKRSAAFRKIFHDGSITAIVCGQDTDCFSAADLMSIKPTIIYSTARAARAQRSILGAISRKVADAIFSVPRSMLMRKRDGQLCRVE